MSDPPSSPNIGLCERCRHATIIRSARESVFYKCERSATDNSFPKYPRLPVIECIGFEEQQADRLRDQPEDVA